MPKSGRIVTATLGLSVLVAGVWLSWLEFSAYQQRHSYERTSAAQYYSDATQHGPSACRSIVNEEGLIGWFTCLLDKIGADGSVKQAEYDLKAQQDMAAWAFGMLIVTIWLSLISLLGVYFVWRTLVATREMAMDTRRTGEAQTTSYLVMEYVITRPSNTAILVEYSVKNVGITPSQQTKMTIKVRPCNVMGPEEATAFTKAKKISLDAIAGGGKSQSFVMFNSFEEPAFFATWPPRESIIVGADVEIIWSDVFGERHRAWFFMANRDSDFDTETNASGLEYHQKMHITRSTFTKLGRPQNNEQ